MLFKIGRHTATVAHQPGVTIRGHSTDYWCFKTVFLSIKFLIHKISLNASLLASQLESILRNVERRNFNHKFTDVIHKLFLLHVRESMWISFLPP